MYRRMDYDNNGKLNFVEFSNNAYDIFKNYIEFETGGANVPTAEEKFAELDVNKDKYYTCIKLVSFYWQECYYLLLERNINILPRG